MSQKLPVVGGDANDWGVILNGFLQVSHAKDGTLNPGVVTNAQLDSPTQEVIASVGTKYVKPSGGIPSSDLSSSVQTNLSQASTAVQSTSIGQPGGVASLNNSGSVPSSQLPMTTALTKTAVVATGIGPSDIGAQPATSIFDPFGLGFPVTFDPLTQISSVTNPGQNVVVYMPCRGYGYTISNLNLQIGTSSGNVSVGIYSSTGTGTSRVPSTLRVGSGSVSCPATGYHSIALNSSITINQGDFIAIVFNNSTATLSTLTGIVAAAGVAYTQSSTFPLGLNAGSLSTSSAVYFVAGS